MTFNTFIKPSPIHGLGLFALVDIKKGDTIMQGTADYDSYRDEWIRYVKKCKRKSFTFNNNLCMVNHSETPNTHREGEEMDIIASRDIKSGEEITEDYNALPDEENPFKSIIAQIQELVYQSS